MLSRWRRWFYYPLKESVKMKVLMLNGSCNVDGSTRCGLDVMARTFAECGIETEIVNLGNRPVQDCIACGKCGEKKQCVFSNDGVNEFVQKAYDADGFVFASPVYYAHPSDISGHLGPILPSHVARLPYILRHCFCSSARTWK